MNLVQLRALVAVADTGSFTLAAESLGITQSGVSQAVAALEASLGVACVDRNRGAFALTDVGRRVVEHAREGIAHTECIRQEAASAKGLASGKVRIGSFSSACANVLPSLLAAFKSRYPGVDLVLMEGGDAEIRNWLDARVIDVGMMTLPVEGLTTLPLGRDEWLAVVSRGHALARRPSVRLAQLAKEPFVLCRGGCEARILELARVRGVKLRVQFDVQDTTTQLQMVREGLGVTIAPSLGVPGAASGLAAMALSPRAYRPFALVTLPGVTHTPALDAFLKLAATQAGDPGEGPRPSPGRSARPTQPRRRAPARTDRDRRRV